MSTIIAIVGRPNVGKSTLFNRITHSRNALVADRPGVTRDRQYGYGHHGDRTFVLIDTGGLEQQVNKEMNISARVSEQSMRAIEEADAVLWMVDGRSGLTTADEVLAEQLRPLSSNLFLVVNKTEGLDIAVVCSEFHSLGVGQPLAISAGRGDGVDALVGEVLEQLPAPESETILQEDGLRVGIIGRPNVGKSTLVNRMLGEDRMLTFDQPGTTRDSVAVPFERRDKHYVLIDTAGVRRRARITDVVEKYSVIKTLKAVDMAQIVVMVIDAHDVVSDQDLNLLGIAVDSGKSLIVAVNKWDGIDDDQKNIIRSQLDRKLDFVDYACVHFISALHGTGVGNLFDLIDKIGKSQASQLKSSMVTELLHALVEAHPPPLVRGRRIKLRYAHIGGHNPLRIIVHGNQTEHVPNNYRRYLSNKIRQRLKLIGTPVMIEFKHGDNPFKGRVNVLNKRQIEKRRRLMKHVKSKK
ncbi:MAG: ribosome biogenesis GTPase Der [Gammaproteobacteria bacterium]|jgi:GTPase|nr:ribosome biogenesis GTPase Der [Gammaproteobacteria bacterium]